MAYTLIQHTVADAGRWKAVFDDHEAARKAAGSLGSQYFCDPATPNDIVVLITWDEIEHARAFLASADLHQTMQRAGVEGEPQVQFLTRIEHRPA